MSRSITSLSNKLSTARCTFEAEPSTYRRTNSSAKTVASLGEHEQLLVVLYGPQQIGDFLLPIAEGVSTDHATVFKGVFHITLFALRNLRNTTTYPTSKSNSGLWVT